MSVELPQRQVAPLLELAARLFESRKSGLPLEHLARDLLRGFFDVCALSGLDNVLDALDVSDRTALEERKPLLAALVTRLEGIDLDGGGPGNAKPGQMVNCVVAALEVTIVEEPDRSIAVDDDVRVAVVAAITGVVNTELAVPAVREAIIAEARTRCDPSYVTAFNKIVAQLDDRGAQLLRQPKVPIDASHAVQRALAEARTEVSARVARTAIDRVAAVLPPEAAARLDQPITVRSTPRDVAILRACDPRVGMTQAKVIQSLFDSVAQLLCLIWRAPEQRAQPYGASKTFEVGDLIEHPKFGRGTVVSRLAQRIDVAFPDGKVTLVHVPPETAKTAMPSRRPEPPRTPSDDES